MSKRLYKCIHCGGKSMSDTMDIVFVSNIKKRVHKDCLSDYEDSIKRKKFEKKYRDILNDYVKVLHNVKNIPSNYYMKLNEIKGSHSYKLVYLTYKVKDNMIRHVLNTKSFNNKSIEMRYVLGIINSSIEDVKDKLKKKVKKNKEEKSMLGSDKSSFLKYNGNKRSNKNDITHLINLRGRKKNNDKED